MDSIFADGSPELGESQLPEKIVKRIEYTPDPEKGDGEEKKTEVKRDSGIRILESLDGHILNYNRITDDLARVAQLLTHLKKTGMTS